jgi:hypothetical protein
VAETLALEPHKNNNIGAGKTVPKSAGSLAKRSPEKVASWSCSDHISDQFALELRDFLFQVQFDYNAGGIACGYGKYAAFLE